MNWTAKLEKPKAYLFSFIKWSLLGLLLGGIGGLLGTAFHMVLDEATALRGRFDILIWFLAPAGLLIAGLYRLCRLEKTRGTNEVIEAADQKKDVPPLLGPVIFVSTALTHLFGGSAGREGAALQLGGTLGSVCGRLLRLNEGDKSVLVTAGMSAVFAALFGTPLTACLFSLECIAVGTICSPSLLPCFLAAFTASRISQLLGVPPTTFELAYALPLQAVPLLQTAALAVLLALVSLLFCFAMHRTEHLLKKWMPNPFVRIAVGGALVTALTFLSGTRDYNGAGMDVAARALAGEAVPWAFLLKILFTAITLGAGYKGGEIVPTFFIGATFGCTAAGLLGLDPGFGAALGMVGLFCCVTNSPIASIALSIEMFGAENVLPFALVCVIGFILSGDGGLYASQRSLYPKTGPARRKKAEKI